MALKIKGLVFFSTFFLIVAQGAQALLADTASWRFAVTIDERPVGFHEFEVVPTEAGQRISSQADFNVKVLFVSVFRYVHENTERWQADCLQQIDSSTRMNKERFAVSGIARDDGFEVTRNEQSQVLPGCVQTFAYWNPEFLAAKRLLNSQTGELEEVHVREEGTEAFTVGDTTRTAQRYRLDLEKGHIVVWYDATTNLWLGLESVTPTGQTIRYQPVRLPQA